MVFILCDFILHGISREVYKQMHYELCHGIEMVESLAVSDDSLTSSRLCHGDKVLFFPADSTDMFQRL